MMFLLLCCDGDQRFQLDSTRSSGDSAESALRCVVAKLAPSWNLESRIIKTVTQHGNNNKV